MPRIHVYLPDDLHRAVREQDLPVSDLLQEAVRAAIGRRRLLSPADGSPKELAAEVGEPLAEEQARADASLRRSSHPDATAVTNG